MSYTRECPQQDNLYGNRWHKLALIAIISANIFASVYWINQNVVLIGNDATQYLQTTFEYAKFLSSISPQTIFQAFVYPPYRTPALYIAAQPFVRIFGLDMDGAQMLNVTFLGVVIWLTFLLARSKSKATTALFAALLVGLFPMLSGMARLYYTEMFLTVTVALCLLALCRGQHFAHRGWTFVLGISFGVGLLVKWTMPIYVVLPLAWAVWEGRIWQQTLSVPKPSQVHFRDLVFALIVGGLLSLLWFLPNRSALLILPLGDWILLLWFVILTSLAYAIRRPASPPNNLAAAMLLALAIASLWYGPHADFGSRLLAVDAERSQEAIGLWGSGNYLRYTRFIYEAQFGPLMFWLMVPIALVPWLGAVIWNRKLLKDTAILWLSLLSSIAVLSVLSQANARNLVPLIPTWSVLAAVGLWLFPWQFRSVVAIVWVIGLLIQWSFLSFDALAGHYAATKGLWARSGYALAPASGETDPGYWIAPDILNHLDNPDEMPASLAVLVNTRQLHRGVLKYLASIEDFNVEFNDATEAMSRGWFEMFASEWVLFKDGDNRELEGDGYRTVERILAQDPLFRAMYQESKHYSLPNGDTVYLFHRTAGPGHPKVDRQMVEDAAAVTDAIKRDWSASSKIVYGDSDLVVWIGMHDPPTDRFLILDQKDSLTDRTSTATNDTIMLVLDQDTAQTRGQMVSEWYPAMSIGTDRIWVEYYGDPLGQLQRMNNDVNWPAFELQSVDSLDRVAPGAIIPLQLSFSEHLPQNLKISLRLIAGNHQMLSSHDTALRPAVRAGLFVPPQTPPDTYRIEAVVYDEQTLAPIPDASGREQALLFEIEVAPIPD